MDRKASGNQRKHFKTKKSKKKKAKKKAMSSENLKTVWKDEVCHIMGNCPKFEERDKAHWYGDSLSGWSIFWCTLLSKDLRKENKA